MPRFSARQPDHQDQASRPDPSQGVYELNVPDAPSTHITALPTSPTLHPTDITHPAMNQQTPGGRPAVTSAARPAADRAPERTARAGRSRATGPTPSERPPFLQRARRSPGRTALGVTMVAGLLIPIGVPLGFGLDAAVAAFSDLPGQLPAIKLAEPSRILAADGSLLATVYLQDRDVVTSAQIPQAVRDAVVSTEDVRFYVHGGVDARGIVRAAANDLTGGHQQGASTITQQYVKNVLLAAAVTPAERSAATARTLHRKLVEAKLALVAERTMTKDQILTGYLNLAYFGHGSYGIAAAARRYLSKSLPEITVADAALLAGLVEDPLHLDPIAHPQAATARRATVLGRMVSAGKLTSAEAAALRAASLNLKPSSPTNGCVTSSAPFFCQMVLSEVNTDPAFGATPTDREAALLTGGLTLRTGLVPAVQRAAQEAVDAAAPRTSRIAVTSVVIEPGTGVVQAVATNRGFGDGPGLTQVVYGTRAAFQPGSTFKLFTLAAALERGISPSLQLAGGNHYISTVFDNPPGGYSNSADGEGGSTDMAHAIAHSINTWFVQLEEKVGVRSVAEMAHRLGVTSLPVTGPGSPGAREGSLTLGAREVSPLEMANAYATIAAHGVHCDPVLVTATTRQDDSAGPHPSRRCSQVLDAAVADTITQLLTGVISFGTGQPNAQIGRAAAGKTGTTSGFGAAWFVGFTPQLSAAVMVSDPRGPSFPLVDVLGYSRIFGGDVPAKTWADLMKQALAEVPDTPFSAAPATTASVTMFAPSTLGLSEDAAVAALGRVGLRTQASYVAAHDGQPLGVVVSASVAAGTKVTAGQVVEVDISH